MRTVTIAMADIIQGDKHIMQRRDHDPRKAAAGLIGFFGGQVEENESPEQTVVRELGEEMVIDVGTGSLTEVGPFETGMDHDGESLKIEGDCYRLEMPPGALMSAKEGSIVEMTNEELTHRIHELSPATRAVVQQYYMEGNE